MFACNTTWSVHALHLNQWLGKFIVNVSIGHLHAEKNIDQNIYKNFVLTGFFAGGEAPSRGFLY
jgi:hypothetical protein